MEGRDGGWGIGDDRPFGGCEPERRGGTPIQAGAAQLLVLIGLLATQTITVVVAARLVRSARLLPTELRERLPE